MSTEALRPKKGLERLEDGRPRFRGCSRITDYEYLGKLGEGTFGEVSKARSKKTGQIVALKKVLMHNEKDGFPITALREIKLLKQLDHVNILKLEEMAVERPKNERKKPSMYMVTPYMDHDLSGLLENPDVHFTESQIKCYMKQLLEGCAYLHENKILHRDMKAANLLINNRGVLQIADFGLARPYDDEPPKPGHGGGEATREYTTLVVTRWYRPPELLLQLRKYTTAIDMWGVGCVFGEMFKRKPILTGNSDLNQAQLIFELVGSPTEETMPGWRDLPGCENITEFGQHPSTLSRVFRELSPLALSLLSELLKLDWRKRINAIDALQHPYFHSEPYPARPGDLPSFEDSHELDRKKFRDQKSKPPPAPAGGSVGIGPQGEWGISGRPIPPYEGRGGGGPGSRVPGGRPYANGHNNQGYHRRPHGPPAQNGAYGGDYRGPIQQPPHRDGPPYDQGHRPPYDQSRIAPPSQPYEDNFSRRPPAEHTLPPRPPNPDIDHYRYGLSEAPPYRDDGRGPPPMRSRVPPGAGGANPDSRRPNHDRDTYIPPYSNADPNARVPNAKNRRRDDRPPYRDGQHSHPHGPPDHGEPMRYDDAGPDRDRDRDRDRRPRSRSPMRDWERDRDRDWERDRDRDVHRERDRARDWDRDRDRDRERDHRDRDRDRDRNRGYGMQDPYRR
ncbi:serine/threonine-protein kinase bur1 [Rhinocladiella mackenziei CBS 650.93]|uniref:Serine/threonine-protein kinase BUR1 n=1 Tax=Rhinocladiella mackenziei CBS 650.93 TaxID=1442369 RepID=A0A0D2G605_9EURO|nr:serine/threonine-protein kinase bur1 [Rhinocladiella mackenziei CBS 650.93]KIX10372.1 serine/threonine-protein kinase bur1 [Rhinocladiella mackenziei CBS 650.93]